LYDAWLRLIDRVGPELPLTSYHEVPVPEYELLSFMSYRAFKPDNGRNDRLQNTFLVAILTPSDARTLRFTDPPPDALEVAAKEKTPVV
tara:strand:- start:53 stop:319 length:267 start_codon:yes stop_codon:yes gene_type:complete